MIEKAIDVTAIIPVYHVGKDKLDRAIDSLLKQREITLEIIVICNGMDEGIRKHCREQYREEKKIRFFELEEANVSEARNIGIRNAEGDYIGFVDADDFVEEEMYSTLYRDAMRTQSDIVICDYYKESDSGIRIEGLGQTLASGVQRDLKQLIDAILGADKSVIMGSVWRFLYRRSLLLSKKIEFDVGLGIGEDVLFNLEVLQQNPILYYEPRPLYHYMVSTYSSSMNMDSQTWDKYFKYLEKLIIFIRENLELTRYRNSMEKRICDTSIWITNEYIASRRDYKTKYLFVDKVSRSKKKLELFLHGDEIQTKRPIRAGILLFCLDREWIFAALLYGELKNRIRVRRDQA